MGFLDNGVFDSRRIMPICLPEDAEFKVIQLLKNIFLIFSDKELFKIESYTNWLFLFYK